MASSPKRRKIDPDAHRNSVEKLRACAEEMVPLIGRLRRMNGVILSLFGEPLGDCSSDEILRAHACAAKKGMEIDVSCTSSILNAVLELQLKPMHIDIGSVSRLLDSGKTVSDLLAGHISASPVSIPKPRDCVLYGFGRIGRVLCRLMTTGSGVPGLALRAIVLRPGKANDLQKRASLLKFDSVHGKFAGTVEVDEDQQALVVNGFFVKIIYSSGPDEVDYTAHNIADALVVDNTGIWKDSEGLGKHLKSPGVVKVLLTAPGSGIPNIVAGVNDHMVTKDCEIYSAASCTTNAITPVLKVMMDKYGVETGHIETVHSYTNDQNLVDNQHSKDRRGRSAPVNMVITETGAGKAVSKAIPDLAGKLTSNAIRVPTPNVSLAILILNLGQEVSVEDANRTLQQTAFESKLAPQIGFSEECDAVSSDFVGDTHSGTVDAKATMTAGKKCNLYVWYDNEWGYSCQVVRLMSTIANMELLSFP